MSPVVSASFGTSFTVAMVDASDMDFGRKGELIGTRDSGSPSGLAGLCGDAHRLSHLILARSTNSQVAFTFLCPYIYI